MTIVREQSRIVERFLSARRAATGLDDFPGDLPSSLDEAYRIQDKAIAQWQRPVLGWKVGRIMPPLSDQLGAERLSGPIFDVSQAAGNGSGVVETPVFTQGFAAAEAEFLFRIGSPPAPDQRQFTLDEAADHIDAVHVGIEIASSPLPTINDIGALAVISDFGNNNGLVVGPAIPDWRSSGLEEWDVVTGIDGERIGSGRATGFPSGAIGSVRFLFELMARRGIALEAGQWVSTGAVTGVHDVLPGQLIEADFGGRLSVSCRAVAAQAQSR